MAITLDLVVFAIAFALGVLGAVSGIIKEVFRFAGMIVGFMVAFLYYVDLQSVIVAVLKGTPVQAAAVMAFLAIFITVFLAFLGAGLLLRKFTEMMTFGMFDRLLGALLGVSKAALIAWVACLSISSLPTTATTTVETVENEHGQMVDRHTVTSGVTQEQFSGSVVFRCFNLLPESMRLNGLEGARGLIRRSNTPTEEESPGTLILDSDGES